MEIKRGQEVVADVYVKSSSYTHEEINGEHIACVDFDSSAALSFSINDSITYMGNPYYIRYKESVTKEETSVGYRYRITFYHALYRLHDVAFFLYDQPDFRKRMSSYTGTALQVLTLVLASLNRVYPGWLLGDVEPTRAQTFNFKDKTCAEVADELTSAYEMEFWVDGRTLYFGKREDSVNAQLTLSQGSGFRSITVSAVDETPPVTRLYAYGSDVNITSEQGDYLSLPGGETCIEANTDKYGVIEHVMQFEEVYPHGEFTVTERIDDCTLRASGMCDTKLCE